MLDLKLIRQQLDLVSQSLKNRGASVNLQELLDLDDARRDLLHEVEQKKQQRNHFSQMIGKGELSDQEKNNTIQSTKLLGEEIKEIDEQIKILHEQIETKLLVIPNLLDSSTPIGKSEKENVIIRNWGKIPEFNFSPQHHADLGKNLDIIDSKRGVKIAQARFTLLKKAAAQLERALINFMLDFHTQKHGYQEILPPFLVNSSTMTATGQLPKFKEDLFQTTDDLYLIPTGEVPLTNIHNDEILDEEQLPIYYTAYTPCFRSEAGSYGKDTKGYIRQHQFNKVELVKFCHPDQSMQELEKLVNNAEVILQALELPYRVMALCSGDIGFSATKCYDLEVWLPSENCYREISSCSNCLDFQARRAKIRFKPKDGGKTQFVHTLNGSGLAAGRTLIAILENYQQADGSIKIPTVLIPYMNGLTEIRE